MITETEFAELRNEFCTKAEIHLTFLQGLTLESYKEHDNKELLREHRKNATLCYAHFVGQLMIEGY